MQNQNNGYFAYNYGRPTNDYRDKFQAAATDALKEHFEFLSVTFQSDKVNSRALPEYGWRFTPYAYLLLKPHGPQIDKIPPIRIDLDFLETSGYVVLPIESATLPIDAANKFQFAAAKRDGTEMTYQRYQDADLAIARPEVDLEETYGAASHGWLVWAMCGFALVGVVAALAWRFRRPARKEVVAWTLPANLTPFTVLGLLKRIQQENGLDKSHGEELARSIGTVFDMLAPCCPSAKSMPMIW